MRSNIPFGHRSILRRRGLSKVISVVRQLDHSYELSLRKHMWLRSQAGKNSNVHKSLEITGVRGAFQNLHLGAHVIIEREVTIWLSPDDGAHAELIIDDSAFIGRNTYLGVFQPITIGHSALIGAYSYIISANHRYERRELPIMKQGFVGAPVVIGSDAWLGTHVVVLPGVKIGRGAIIAAGSVVNTDVPAFELWGGIPARFLKARP